MKGRALLGETLGMLILVTGGCATNGIALLHGPISLEIICLGWAMSVFIAILVSARFSDAHLNPAVTLVMWLGRNVNGRVAAIYLLGQVIGATLAGFLILLIFGNQLEVAEVGGEGVVLLKSQTATVFADFYHNDGADAWLPALGNELLGTFLLIIGIYLITARLSIRKILAPLLIGLLVGLLIYWLGKQSMLGINPARDLFPRLVAGISGWKESAFQSPNHSFLTVYVLAPLVGGILAWGIQRLTVSISGKNSSKEQPLP